MLVIKETVSKFRFGYKLVGVAPVQIIDDGHRFVKGILLRAAGDNDPVSNVAPIWIGDSTVNITVGMPLAPGETLTLPLENCDDLYAVSSVADQNIAWMGL